MVHARTRQPRSKGGVSSKPTLAVDNVTPLTRPRRRRAAKPTSFEVAARNQLEKIITAGATQIMFVYEIKNGTEPLAWISTPESAQFEHGCAMTLSKELLNPGDE